MIRIGLIGYGRMGKLIHEISEKNDVKITQIFDPNKHNILSSNSNLSDVEVFIDFSTPEKLFANAEIILKKNKKLVIGTTGWYENLGKMENLCHKYDSGIIVGGNFSVGMNAFYEIINYASKLFNKLNDYDVYGWEQHHSGKADSPSGTAKEISSIILNNIERKTIAQFDKLDRKIKPEELHFASIRGGRISGIHNVQFDSPFDTLTLNHSAKNRQGFAIGAIEAAKWLSQRKGFYMYKDIFKGIYNL